MAHVDYYFSTLSPYAYLAGLRLEKAAARTGATITYKPIDIIALFERTGGTPPNQRHPARQEYRAQELMRWARKLDMPFTLKPAHWPTNAAPSSYAIISAQRSGGGAPVPRRGARSLRVGHKGANHYAFCPNQVSSI